MPVEICDEDGRLVLTLHDRYGASTCRVNHVGMDPRINRETSSDPIVAKRLKELWEARTSIVPDPGSFIGWKRLLRTSGPFYHRLDVVIAQLEILSGARRCNDGKRECRAEAVKVVAIEGADVGYSIHGGHKLEFRVGEIVRCDQWGDRWGTRLGGIFFYLTRAEAQDY